MSLVSTDWLNKNLNKVKIIDASWHLVKNRNGGKEYDKEHIEDAIFFLKYMTKRNFLKLSLVLLGSKRKKKAMMSLSAVSNAWHVASLTRSRVRYPICSRRNSGEN